MDASLFVDDRTGDLVEISGSDPRHGEWRHVASRPSPLPQDSPQLSGATYRAVADARAALAALDSTARRVPNPSLLRTPAMRREAQATASLEGTHAPLADVYAADEDSQQSPQMREICTAPITTWRSRTLPLDRASWPR